MLESFGSLSDLVIAVATLLTLGYLAVQIRAGNRLMRADAQRTMKGHATQLSLAIATEKQLASVFRRGLEDYKTLDPDELTQFTFIISEYFSAADESFSERKIGIDSEESLNVLLATIRMILGSRGGRKVWNTYGHQTGSPGFVQFIEAEILPNIKAGTNVS